MSQAQSQTHVVKKHVGAIHISNNISLLQRKVSNALLLNAYSELLTKEEHSIAVSALADVVGFDSKNTDYLREALEGLAKTTLQWNLMDEAGVAEWGVLSILAEARVKGGICTYVYPPTLRNMLADPTIYALLDVRIQRRFQSAYALALFENCLRYASIGRSPVWELELFKKLLGVPEGGLYDDFRFLNRNVIKKSVDEINTVSTIEITPILHKESRRVVAIQFEIREKKQEEMQLEAPLFNVVLLGRLVDEFEVTESQAKKLLSQHTEDYIIGNLEVVAERIKANKVKEIGPYTLRAMRDDFRIKPSALKDQIKRGKTRKVEQTNRIIAQQSKVDLNTQGARAYFEALDAAGKEGLIEAYRASKLTLLIRKRLEESGIEHHMVNADFMQFVARTMPAGQ